MPQKSTNVLPMMLGNADGINDQVSLVKKDPGTLPFTLNYDADSDVWNRRAGRDLSFLVAGEPVMNIYDFSWSDGIHVEIATIGDEVYNLSTSFAYLLDVGVRLIFQSPDLNYWDVTPSLTTGLITPTVVATPTATAQAGNLTVQMGEKFGFLGTTNTVQLGVGEPYSSWFAQVFGVSAPVSLVTDDLVFTSASGFSLIEKDFSGNSWKFSVDNIGQMIITTV